MVTKDVGQTLPKSRSFRRRPGVVPYPVRHIGPACSAFDVWNNMFRTYRGQNLTLHQFEPPPAVVLDLGCGSGYWAIEAAKKWPNSVVIGFDVKEIQPRLYHALFRRHHSDIAHRVKWVHGNFLDGLPFQCDYFDFVRVANIGLGVPEDEWQYVFEEVARVLKPGGVIEVIEEDLIFPYEVPQPLPETNQENSSTTTLVNDSPSIPMPSTPLPGSSPTVSSVTLHGRCEPNSSTSPNNLSSPALPLSAHPSPSKPPISPHPASHPDPPNTPQGDDKTPDESSSPKEVDNVPSLQDHSRLKAAWDAMLASRFILKNTLSVLPFYLLSLFADVQCMPPIKVLLPPNSDTSSPDCVFAESIFDGTMFGRPSRPSPLVRTSSVSTISSGCDAATLTPSALSSTPSDECIDSYTTEFAQMHLASTVHTVMGCKEAIWQEYKTLYDVKVAKKVRNAPSGHTAIAGPVIPKSSVRESFDDDWAAWYNDMTDRIGMRALMSQLNWDEPSGQRPEWHVWRTKVQESYKNKDASDVPGSAEDPSAKDPSAEDPPVEDPSAEDPPAVCRSMRGFFGWKPLL